MIPADTPPGKRLLVVLDDLESVVSALRPEYRDLARTVFETQDKHFRVGHERTLRSIVESPLTVCGYAVTLRELDPTFQFVPQCFRLADEYEVSRAVRRRARRSRRVRSRSRRVRSRS